MSNSKNNEKHKKKDEISIKEKRSSLSEFIKRPLPTDEEVSEFEELMEEEAREEEIEESLSEIYQDENGEIVDVSKMNIKKKRGFFFWLSALFFSIIFFSSAIYGVYYYFFSASGSAMVEFSIEGQEKIMAGEEFFYKINYRNPGRVNLKNIRIEVDFPENFVLLDSLPAPDEKNNIWHIDSIVSMTNSSIKIKGKIIDKPNSPARIFANMTYVPENFSSEFRTEASFAGFMESIGIDSDFYHPSTALVGEESEIKIELRAYEKNYLTDFIIEAEEAENIEFITVDQKRIQSSDTEEEIKISQIKPNTWKVSGLTEKIETVFFNYKVKEKINDEQEIKIFFKHIKEKESEEGVVEERNMVFFEKDVVFEVMKSDLNLSLEINELKVDHGVNFEDILNYKIIYANKGDEDMKDLVIMAVLDSDFIDWTTLEDKNRGRERGNMIFWTKNEIPELEKISKNQEGEIEFSVKVLPFREMDLGGKFEIRSYAQYSIDDRGEIKEGNDNRSNTIVNKINSDLSLSEKIRYFNEDNIPVGTGPLPPKAGEETSFKVYWTLTNNINELNNVEVQTSLPSYVKWNEKARTSVGSLFYDEDNHSVVWQIGRMPISVYRIDAEFSLSLTPLEEDRNKILVLLSGSKVSALDTETGANIVKTKSPKTTKLEDDEIAQISSDGRIE